MKLRRWLGTCCRLGWRSKLEAVDGREFPEMSRASFVEWLHALHRRRETGVLRVTGEGVRTEIQIIVGRPVFATEGAMSTTLGRILVKSGVLTVEQYDTVIEKLVAEEQRPSLFGTEAVAAGMLSSSELDEALTEQVRSRLLGCIEWQTTISRFEQGSTRLAHHGSYPVSVEPVILRGIRLYYDPARFGPVLEPGWRSFPVCTDAPDEIARRLGLSALEQRFVAELDGSRRTDDLVSSSSLDSVSAGQVLAALVTTRSIRFNPTSAAVGQRSEATSEEAGVERAALAPPIPAHRAVPAPGPARVRAAARVTVALRAAAAARAPAPRSGGEDTSSVAAVTAAAAPAPPSAEVDVERRRRSQAELHFQRGKRALAAGYLPVALTEFRAASRLLPQQVEYELHVGWVELVSQTDPAQAKGAREHLETLALRAVRQDRSMAFAHFVQGHLLMSSGDDQGALRAVRVAFKLDPELSEAKHYEQLILRRLLKG